MKPKDAGFTLVEVLVSFAILSLVLAALYEATAGAYRGEARKKIYEEALASARTHLDAIGAEHPLQAGETSGAYASGLKWRLSIEPHQSHSVKGEVFRIVIEPLDETQKPILRLETFKLRPKDAGAFP